MRETDVEKQLVRAVKKAGGLCLKFISPTMNGMPDRIIIMDSRIVFVELKAPGQKPRPLQLTRHKLLTNHGATVYVIDHTDQIPGLIHEIHAT